MQHNSSILLEEGKNGIIKGKKREFSLFQAQPALLRAHGRRSWTEIDDGAGWCTKGHAGCAWQQNNWRGIVVPASNCFGIVWNHVHLEWHCCGVCISTIAHADLINSHYPMQALDHFCTQGGPQNPAQQHQPFTELQLIQSRWGTLQDQGVQWEMSVYINTKTYKEPVMGPNYFWYDKV